MNSDTSSAFMEKMMEAKRMELEAIMMLVPDKMKGHLEVIGREVRMMLMDCIMEMYAKHEEDTATKPAPSGSKVKKVDIG